MKTNRSFKKLFAALMLFAFVFSTVSPAMAGGLAKITDIQGGGGGSVYDTATGKYVASDNAKTIYFGNYWQSYSGDISTATAEQKANIANYKKEGIKWRVLANDAAGTENGKTFLMSDQSLYSDQFNSSSVTANKNVWGKDESSAGAGDGISSKIRTTMNNTTVTTFKSDGSVNTWGGFAGDAFSTVEYETIAATTNKTYDYDSTTEYKESTDKIFLLSAEEAMNTSYGFTSTTGATDTRKAPATEMAQHVAMYGNTEAAKVAYRGISFWRLRTPGIPDAACYVHNDGEVFIYGSADNGTYAARAALNLNQDDVLFLSAAEATKSDETYDKNSKSRVDVGNGFALADYDGSNGWKLTLKGDSIAAPTDVTVTQTTTGGVDTLADATAEGGTIDLTGGVTVEYSASVVKYTAAAINETDPLKKANYVSAIVTDSTGANMLNYAKIGNTADGSAGVSVGFGTLADGTYKMYVYAEQANGDKETDYASAFSNTEGYEFIKGSTTVNEGTLSTGYATKALTANLGGDFNLSFENDTYNTGVTVGANDNGTITADATNGTTLTGNISVGTGATLTTENEFKFGGDVEINGTLFDKDRIEISDTLNTGNGAVLKGEDAATSTLTTQKLNGTGDLTIKDITVHVTESGRIAGDLAINDARLEGEGKDETTVTADTISSDSDAELKDITVHVTESGRIAGDLAINDARLEGEGKDETTVTADTISSDSDAELKDITVHVTTGGEITGDLAINDARLEGEGKDETTVTAKTFTENGESELKDITVNVTDIADINGRLTLDEAALNGGVINVNGTLDTKGGSSITGDITINGDYNVNETTYISGKLTPKGNLNFNLDGEEKKNGYVFLNVENPVDLKDATVNLIQTDEYYKLNKDETMTLITKAINYMGDPEVQTREGVKKYLYSVGLDANSALMLGYLDQGVADQTKSFSEARLGASAALNSASDLIAGQAIDSASSSGLWEAFAAIQGSHSRYETGSHIDLNSTNVAAGLSKKIKDNVTLGLFVEGGNGRYTTENEFEDGNVRADGDINYFGGGIFAKVEGKKTAKGQLHGEASFRAGHMNSDYNSETFNPGTSTRFDTSNSYLGAHAGLGYKWSLKDNSNIDTYVKYLWNRQNSDSPVIAGEQFDLDAINSHRLRAGFRYNGKENENGVKFFGGLAYEYEFDGTAKGHMGEYALLEPDFKGGSGMAELGIKYHKPNSPWKVELGVTGYTGKRDSIGANLNAWYEFGK
ncbi:MAG: autotransporter domain-containing protein [Synergistaceae bacterium]|nr:autotransporter domain-containing protein [Synergistaceae bacterium]